MKFITKLFLFSSSLLPLSAANLLFNGSFESYSGAPSPGATEATILTDGLLGITEWDAVGPCDAGNCALLLGTDYTENMLQFQAQDGARSVDLTGSGHSALAGGINQAVNLTTGLSYTLTFWLGNMDDSATNYGGASALEVLINGISMGTFTNSASTLNLVNWAQQSLTFTALTEINTIRFRDATISTDHYAGLDNAFLDLTPGAETPEPGTFALAAAAIGAFAFARRRTVSPRH